MDSIAGVPVPVLLGQILLGMINGAFYAMLTLGLSLIFGMLGIVNLVHGALFMTGAFVAWILLDSLGIGYWGALVLSPLIVGLLGAILHRTMIKRIQGMDHLYALVLTLGMALVIEGLFRQHYGTSGQRYQTPEALRGALNLGVMIMPYYRGWVLAVSLVVCIAAWLLVEKTRLGAMLRAVTENAPIVQSFGINVPRLVTATYAAGVALAAFAGVLAAPLYSINPQMGTGLNIVVFALVVIGGMGSIFGSIITAFALGIVEGLTKVYFPQGSSTVIFFVMIVVLLARPAGLFGKAH